MPSKSSEKQFRLDLPGDSRTTCRITLTVPVEVRDQLDALSRRFGITRSALVSNLLSQSLTPMTEIMAEVPDTDPSESDIRRMRGKSADLIGDMVSNAFRAALDGAENTPHD